MDLGFAVLVAFFVLFVLGFPVVFAILIPSLAYIGGRASRSRPSAQRVLYALDSFPLVAVPVFIFVGNLMNAGRHHRTDLSLRQHARRAACRAASRR